MDAWALMSLSDKTGIEELAQYFTAAGLKLLATSSTAQQLRQAGFAVESVEALTGFGEILDGRVKTLHPLIYAGLLASGSEPHQQQRRQLQAPDIRAVVVNLYPFEQAWQSRADEPELIETIDIGGVSLIRAAAKNYERVAVLVSPAQYAAFMRKPWSEHSLSDRRGLAGAAFQHVAYYDALIAEMLTSEEPNWPDYWVLAGKRRGTLRYGENPHQSGAFYQYSGAQGLARAQVLQGKPLSYNNYADVDAALGLAYDLREPAAVVVKHQTPCAAAVGASVKEAYAKAHEADPVSIFGGIVAVNQLVDESLAEQFTQLFLEVVAAPSFSDGALRVLSSKKNLRVLQIAPDSGRRFDVKGIWGGFLMQPSDQFAAEFSNWQHVAGPDFDEKFREDVILAWKTAARVKSNAIVVVKDGATVGIGGGQTNRVDAARHALERAGDHARGAVLASDGFFPFDDVLRLAQECGIAIVVEPGGSMRDNESIAVAESAGITLLMTGERHFRH